MKITASIIEEGLGRVSIESPLFKEYFLNYEGFIHKKFDIGATVTRVSGDSLYVDIPMDKINDILKLSQSFMTQALKNKLEHTEFIPLHGYSVDDLHDDVINANNAGRDFMIVSTYQDYSEHTQDSSYTFNQYHVKYGTSEWADIFLDLYGKDIKAVRKKYQDKITKQNWF